MQVTWKTIIIGFLLGVIGGLVGALGGAFLSNYLPLSFQVGEKVGYEAAGFIGLLLGLVLSGIVSMLLTNRQVSNKASWISSFAIGTGVFIGALLLAFLYDAFDKSLHLPVVLSVASLLFAWIGTPLAIAKFGKAC